MSESNSASSPFMQMTIGNIAYTGLSATDISVLHQNLSAADTYVVKESFPALEVAQIVDMTQPNMVVVLNESNEIAGVVSPTFIKRQVPSVLQTECSTMQEAVLNLAQCPAEQQRSFCDEQIKGLFPKFRRCPAGHWTDMNPCSEHGM